MKPPTWDWVLCAFFMKLLWLFKVVSLAASNIYFMVRSTCRHLFDYGESEKSIMANKNCLANLKISFPMSVSVHCIDAAISVMKQWTVLFLVAWTQLTFCVLTNLKRLTPTVLQTVLQTICHFSTCYHELCKQTWFVECFVVLCFYDELCFTGEHVRRPCRQNNSGQTVEWKNLHKLYILLIYQLSNEGYSFLNRLVI